MFLYIIYDSLNDSYSHPLIASDISEVISSLLQLNPSNLSNLSLIPLLDFTSIPEFISLIQCISSSDLPPELNLSSLKFRSGEVTSSPTHQPTGGSLS